MTKRRATRTLRHLPAGTIPGGALAGALATVPFSATAVALHARLPRRERYALPPGLITERMEQLTGLEGRVGAGGHTVLTLVGHFGYGALMGALYAPLADSTRAPPLITGPLFGLAVWAGSYLGWLPALGILAPATRAPARRNATMIAAHLVWGLAAGLLAGGRSRR